MQLLSNYLKIMKTLSLTDDFQSPQLDLGFAQESYVIKIIGPRDKKVSNAINTTSTSNNWSKNLSPFFLGPCRLYNDLISQNMENAWQYSKVYLDQVDQEGNPTKNYFNWAKTGWNKSRADRYPRGKGAKPLYSYWNGEKLDYIEARKKIYIPLYANAVQKTDSFQRLVEIYQKNKSITLFDFDGYDYLSLKMTLQQVIEDPTRKMGHGFVLAMLLEKLT